MNYTPEQQRDIARLQELGALVTDVGTVKYETEVAPEKGIWKYLAQGLDIIISLLTLCDGIAFALTVLVLADCGIDPTDCFFTILILGFSSQFLRLLSKIPAIHIKKIDVFFNRYTCVATAEQMSAIKKEFDAIGVSQGLNTQNFIAKRAFREEDTAVLGELYGVLVAMLFIGAAPRADILDFNGLLILVTALCISNLLLSYLEKKAGKA